MTVPPAGERPPPPRRAPGEASRTFPAALARARAEPASRARARPGVRDAGAAARGDAELGAATASRRRRDADGGQLALSRRWVDAEPGGPAEARPVPLAPGVLGARDVGSSPSGPLWPPGTVELLVRAARQGERPSLELALGRELRVALVRAERGVEVLLHPPAALRARAEAELPALVAALHARGVRVTRAEVRPAPGALTPRRASATTAVPPGTVAKW